MFSLIRKPLALALFIILLPIVYTWTNLSKGVSEGIVILKSAGIILWYGPIVFHQLHSVGSIKNETTLALSF